MTGEKDAPAEMPGVEAIHALLLKTQRDFQSERDAKLAGQGLWPDRSPAPLNVLAKAVAEYLAPILAEKERAELALCELMNAAGHYKATHSEIDREALSATIKAAADHFAAAIRAEGE